MTDWRSQAARLRRAADEAAELMTKPASPLVKSLFTGAILVWSAMFIAAIATLPARVPIHWAAVADPDGLSRADNWVSKPAALAFLAVSFLGILALTLLSRIVLKVPEAINSPHKVWWTSTGERLVRFERLLREDLMLIVAATVTLLACIGTQVTLAAHAADGATPWWVFWVLLGAYLAVVGAIVARMIGSGRYRPDDDATA